MKTNMNTNMITIEKYKEIYIFSSCVIKVYKYNQQCPLQCHLVYCLASRGDL